MDEDKQFADISNRIRTILGECNTSPSLQAIVLADLIAALLCRFESDFRETLLAAIVQQAREMIPNNERAMAEAMH